eukprot:361385-Rhodomonas_salina.1
MSGTDIGSFVLRNPYALSRTGIGCYALCYAVCGTELGYGPTGASVRCSPSPRLLPYRYGPYHPTRILVVQGLSPYTSLDWTPFCTDIGYAGTGHYVLTWGMMVPGDPPASLDPHIEVPGSPIHLA